MRILRARPERPQSAWLRQRQGEGGKTPRLFQWRLTASHGVTAEDACVFPSPLRPWRGYVTATFAMTPPRAGLVLLVYMRKLRHGEVGCPGRGHPAGAG